MAHETLHDATSADAVVPRVGELFADRYRIEALLGRGGMGSVYRAHDLEVDEVVDLEIIDVHSLTGNALERFRREVRRARRVTHRNAARTYDLGEHEGVRHLTMEYIDGLSLRERLRERPSGRLWPGEAVEVALQIADGLSRPVQRRGHGHRGGGVFGNRFDEWQGGRRSAVATGPGGRRPGSGRNARAGS